jgi:hypothetical protein
VQIADALCEQQGAGHDPLVLCDAQVIERRSFPEQCGDALRGDPPVTMRLPKEA